MAKEICSFFPCRLVECPERWEHFKEIPAGNLIIYESEKKKPGKQFFGFTCYLHSSTIKELWTEQESIEDLIYIHIQTENNKYVFEWDNKKQWMLR